MLFMVTVQAGAVAISFDATRYGMLEVSSPSRSDFQWLDMYQFNGLSELLLFMRGEQRKIKFGWR
jgi:arginyl-tRNA synthetase